MSNFNLDSSDLYGSLVLLGESFINYEASVSGTPGNAIAVVAASGSGSLGSSKGVLFTFRDIGNGWIKDETTHQPVGLNVSDVFGRSVSV